jgi:DNA (cytosine-5)-methyltransferase 1
MQVQFVFYVVVLSVSVPMVAIRIESVMKKPIVEKKEVKNEHCAKYGVFSFFSGCGLLDLAFEDEDFEILFVNEIYPPFLDAYKFARENLGRTAPIVDESLKSVEWFLGAEGAQWLKKSIDEAKETGMKIGFIGGPPCPDFSVGGKNRGHQGDNGKLSQTYIDMICAQKPDWFIFENVKGLWRTKAHREFFEKLKTQLTDSGYGLSDKLLNAIQFGAPQDRDRIFLFGKLQKNKKPKPIDFDWEFGARYIVRNVFSRPWPTQTEYGVDPPEPDVPLELTVGHWFKKNAVDTHQNSKHCFKPRAGLVRFMSVAEGDDKKKSYKRPHRFRYSPTACYGNNEVHLHPWLPRRINVAEALSLQSAPIGFALPPTMTLSAMFKTIGNGVPYLLGRGIAQAVKNHLEEKKPKK